jgi:hypothetical protein
MMDWHLGTVARAGIESWLQWQTYRFAVLEICAGCGTRDLKGAAKIEYDLG